MNFKTTPIFAIAILVLLLTSCQNFDLKKSENSSLYFMFENSTEPDLTFVSASNDMLVSNLYYDAYLNEDYDVVITIDGVQFIENKEVNQASAKMNEYFMESQNEGQSVLDPTGSPVNLKKESKITVVMHIDQPLADEDWRELDDVFSNLQANEEMVEEVDVILGGQNIRQLKYQEFSDELHANLEDVNWRNDLGSSSLEWMCSLSEELIEQSRSDMVNNILLVTTQPLNQIDNMVLNELFEDSRSTKYVLRYDPQSAQSTPSVSYLPASDVGKFFFANDSKGFQEALLDFERTFKQTKKFSFIMKGDYIPDPKGLLIEFK